MEYVVLPGMVDSWIGRCHKENFVVLGGDVADLVAG